MCSSDLDIKYSCKQQKVNELSIKSDIKLFISGDVMWRFKFRTIQHRHFGGHYSNADSKHCINIWQEGWGRGELCQCAGERRVPQFMMNMRTFSRTQINAHLSTQGDYKQFAFHCLLSNIEWLSI